MQSPLWAGHRNAAAVQRDLDASGHLDRAPSDSGHQLVTFGSPDITKHLTADTLLACLAIGHETLLVESTATPSPPRTRGNPSARQ